jgi:nitrilase
MAFAAAIQMTSTHEIAVNLKTAERLICQAISAGAKLVVLPENFALMGLNPEDKIKAKEKFGTGPIQEFLASQAKTHHVWIVGGTIPIACKNENKIRSACLVFDDNGNFVARYDKIHLFDVIVVPGKEEHQESATIESGEELVVIDSPIGKLGIAVCYDIRFPELFRALLQHGAEVFAVPAAFTVPTGEAHWEILVRSRAIENLCYFIGACQTGTHTNGRSTYGHSLIVDPWGKKIASLVAGEGFIAANIDLEYSKELRKKMPVIEQRKM